MTIKANLLRNLVLPIGDFVFGQEMITRLKFLENAQYWPLEKIQAKQAEDLRNLIQIAYAEVPFYQSMMDKAEVRPEEINDPADLSKLPIVTKDMLREGYPKLTTRYTGQKTYEASTSGSTGKNFYVMEDAMTAGWYRASFMLSLEWAGWQIGELHLQTGITPDRSLDRRIKDWFLGCHYKSAYQLDDEHLDEILITIRKHNLRHLWGYPGSLYYLAKFADTLGWDHPLSSVVSWGDSLYPHYRQLIESVFQTKVFDTYGCAEGFQIAAQCEYGNYHLHALDTVVEILDAYEKPVKPGKIGNIVVTRLHPGPMPLIRYVVGDLGVPSKQRGCPCGRGLPMMEAIKGRDADVITTPSGNRLIVHFFTGILEHFPEIDSFQVVQTEPDSILLRIQPKGEMTDSILDKIKTSLADKGTSDLQVNFQFVESIPMPPSGKHRFVINQTHSNEDTHV